MRFIISKRQTNSEKKLPPSCCPL